MTAFFVRTDDAIAGPFTGVELREAALAGIIGPEALIGGATDGPWYKAAGIGLFSEKKTPLPHPPDTYVPQYHVRGMPGAFQGPFKLRELIGFAARGMLPPEALLQSDRSDEWIPARRFCVLSACLNGDLVLIDGSGKVVLRTKAAAAASRCPPELSGARAPIELAKSVDARDTTTLARTVSDDESEPIESVPLSQQSVAVFGEGADSPSKLGQACARVFARLRLVRDLRFLIPPRVAIQFVCLLLVFAGVASAFSFWKQIGLRREQVLGDWIAVSGDDSPNHPPFGISLHQDGRCVVFNTRGESWTGNFAWEDRQDDQAGFEQIAPFTSVFDQVDPRHETGTVKPTDGYVRLQGFVKEPPKIDGHPVRDLFLRRVGQTLRIGYLASVHWTQDSKTMQAGWMTVTKSSIARPDIAGELQKIGQELPVPTADFGGELAPHLSEAILAVQRGVPTKVDGKEIVLHESLAYSTTVNAGYLLEHFGLPDEAREIYPFEVPNLRNGPNLSDAQVVRYGKLKFILSSDGQLRYLFAA